MIHPRINLHIAYTILRQRSLINKCTTLIYVSNDCDSICTLHIIVNLLKADNIQHSIIPISGYDDLLMNKPEIMELEMTSIIMINCGGTIDLATEYDDDTGEIVSKHKFFVLDSHRPYHLSNVRESNQNVIVLDDSYENNPNMFPEDIIYSEDETSDNDNEDEYEDENEEGIEDEENADEMDEEAVEDEDVDVEFNEDENENDGGDEDNNSGNNENGVETFPETVQDSWGGDEEEETLEEKEKREFFGDEEGGAENEEPNIRGNTKSRRPSILKRKVSPNHPKPAAAPKKRLLKTSFANQLMEKREREQKRQILTEYYSTTFFGSSSSLLAYELSGQLNKQTNHSLWLAIVGLTDQLILERIPFQRYLEVTRYFEGEVIRFNPSLIPDEENVDRKINPTHGHITHDFEFQTILMRFWNLFDSLLHSRYVCTRLKLWKTAPDRDYLKDLLAKMGIPLVEAQNKYTVMDANIKKDLKDRFSKYAPAYDLQHILYSSFVRRHGDTMDMSAADMVYSINALLENVKTFDFSKLTSDQDSNALVLYDSMKTNFWKAYYSVSRDEIETLITGINDAIYLQRAILRQGRAILEKKDYLGGKGPFKYSILKSTVDTVLFSHPIALTKLALFLMDALVDNAKDSSVKPFVICSPNSSRNTYVVIGVSPGFQQQQGIDDIFYNSFGKAFRSAAEQTKTDFKHDGFDTSLIEVSSDNLYPFLDLLHSGLIGI